MMKRAVAVPISQVPVATQRVVRTMGRDIEVGENSPLLKSAGSGSRGKRQDLEHPEQVALFAWANDPATLALHPELDALYAIPNWFGQRTAQQGMRAKAEGRRKGMLDVCLPVSRRLVDGKLYGACYIELKSLNGSVREAQQEWIQRLRARGNFADVAHSAGAAQALLLFYLSLPKP
jgi:hypothetical protein